MCGIIGYTGKTPASGVLLDGLKRLEYRGYDSAGLALLDGGFTVVRTPGKVRNLEEQRQRFSVTASTGIAHTRWATHGVPSERNAHPHLDSAGEIAVVHNGIIENHEALRSELEKRGRRFASETDSEVIPNLIAEFYKSDPFQAVTEALRRLEGTYGICVLFRTHPGLLIAARFGSPVIIGLGKDFNMAASDITALAPYTEEVIYLNDGELALLAPGNVTLRTLTGGVVTREISRIPRGEGMTVKGKYEHFMLKEIFEQPEALANTIRGRLSPGEGRVKLDELDLSLREISGISRVVIPACGSSLHSGLIGEYYFEDIADLPAEVQQAAEFRYRNPIIEPNTLVVPISQSGETADTLAAVREAAAKGAWTAAITNVPRSSIARECHCGICLNAGPEISVASTKAFTCQTTALWMFAILLGRSRRLSIGEGRNMTREIEELPRLVGAVLDRFPEIEKLAAKYAGYQDFFFIGRDILYPVALEGALKLKEISYVHAEGSHAAELKHGPLALLNEKTPVIALANRIPGQEKLLGNMKECAARHAPVIAVATENDRAPESCAGDLIRVPECSRYASPVVTAVALQIFAYCFARRRGCEIDQPRNLAKSVTVE